MTVRNALLCVIITLTSAIAPVSIAGDTATDGTSAAPRTIPALRQWTQATGSYGFGKRTRLLPTKELAADAAVFADDLAAQTKVRPMVATGTARPGDIRLELGSTDPRLGAEGYRLVIGSTITVQARTATGAFHGTRTILQLLRTSWHLPAGTALDWPTYPVRTVLLHNAPRTAGIGWLRNEIREVSYLKMNEITIFAEDNKLAAAAQAFATRYHVRLVPLLNMPGHLGALAGRPQYQLADRNGKKYVHALDLSNPAARAWAKQQVSDLIPTFTSPYWHVGADEYPQYKIPLTDFPKLAAYAKAHYGPSATAEDVVKGFLNEIDDLLHSKGKSMRLWNDMQFPTSAVQLHKDITIEYWSAVFKPSTPQQLADDGHDLLNGNRDFLFYAAGHNPDGSVRAKTDPEKIYEHFAMTDFQSGLKLPADCPRLTGIRLSEWNSAVGPDSDASIEAGLFETYRVVAQLGWGSPKPYPTWAQFQPLVEKLGRSPGFVTTR